MIDILKLTFELVDKQIFIIILSFIVGFILISNILKIFFTSNFDRLFLTKDKRNLNILLNFLIYVLLFDFMLFLPGIAAYTDSKYYESNWITGITNLFSVIFLITLLIILFHTSIFTFINIFEAILSKEIRFFKEHRRKIERYYYRPLIFTNIFSIILIFIFVSPEYLLKVKLLAFPDLILEILVIILFTSLSFIIYKLLILKVFRMERSSTKNKYVMIIGGKKLYFLHPLNSEFFVLGSSDTEENSEKLYLYEHKNEKLLEFVREKECSEQF